MHSCCRTLRKASRNANRTMGHGLVAAKPATCNSYRLPNSSLSEWMSCTSVLVVLACQRRHESILAHAVSLEIWGVAQFMGIGGGAWWSLIVFCRCWKGCKYSLTQMKQMLGMLWAPGCPDRNWLGSSCYFIESFISTANDAGAQLTRLSTIEQTCKQPARTVQSGNGSDFKSYISHWDSLCLRLSTTEAASKQSSQS